MVKVRRQPKRNPRKQPKAPKKSKSQEDSQVFEDSSSQQSSQELPQVQANLKTLQFRKKRGEKMNYLINKKKGKGKDDEDDDDDFWKNNAYFGDVENMDEEEEEEEEYVESSDGEDEFDSDFLSNKSEKEEEDEDEQVEEEEEKTSRRKRKVIETIKPPTKKLAPKPSDAPKLVLKYIHEEFTQEQLLAEAAHTEYYNYLSLQKLISLEENKKVYRRKQVEIEPPKIIYKNTLKDGVPVNTYTMVGFEKEASFLDMKWPF